MTLYTSDVETIYQNIRDGVVNANSIRILSSHRPQSLSLLHDFINIEEIYCSVVCTLNQVSTLCNLIYQRNKLSRVSVIIYIPPSEKDNEFTPPPKRRRLRKRQTASDIVIKNNIPELITRLGQRMRYLSINISVVDSDNNDTTSFMLNMGTFCVVSNVGANKRNERIFQALVDTGCVCGIVTKGDSNYDLAKISSIQELTIVTRVFNKNFPLNENYLKDLIARSEVVTLVYESDTIDDMYKYSELIQQGSRGTLKQIKGIVPVADVEHHIIHNPNLEEIHTLVRHQDDINDMKYIIETYHDRTITYYVYYHRTSDLEYWLSLNNTTVSSDIVFRDIIRALITNTSGLTLSNTL